MSLTSLGIEIGGLNFQVNVIEMKNETEFNIIYSYYNRYWPTNLEEHLKKIILELKIKIDVIGITTTGEIVFDRFVDAITQYQLILKKYFHQPMVWLTHDGDLIGSKELSNMAYKVAAANWYATGMLIGKYIEKNCIFIDTGSCSTDIIPIIDGIPKTKGKYDYERLATGELVYIGLIFNYLPGLLSQIDLNGTKTTVAHERVNFAGDVHYILGNISKEEIEYYLKGMILVNKADLAYSRIAHLVCADDILLNRDTIKNIAEQYYQDQLQQISNALKNVFSLNKNHFTTETPIVVTGIGAHILASKAAKKAGFKNIIYLKDKLSKKAETMTPSVGIAVLAGLKHLEKKLGRKNTKY